MATLDSPLEVLAFDYVSFILNNLWTWIAVVTAAAVSFWRIRATTSGRDDGFIEESVREPPKPKATAALVEETRPRMKVTETEDWSSLLCNDGVTKGKLTVYYDDDEEIDVERDGEDGESTTVNYGGGVWWERMVRMRNGGDGWYRYVDLTEINGNVVRFWDANGVTNGGWVSVLRKDIFRRNKY